MSKLGKVVIVSCLAFLSLSSAALYASVVRISENFHEVDPGRFYRSAQLFPSELEEAIGRYGIKTVVSLRGAPEHAYWVPEETKLLAEKDVRFFALYMDTDFYPSKEDLTELLRIYRNEPKPILVHCRTGADRTGEASALWVMDQMGGSTEEALQQLSFKYWHVPSFHPAKSDFIRRYRGYEWARNEYDDCKPEFSRFSHCRTGDDTR